MSEAGQSAQVSVQMRLSEPGLGLPAFDGGCREECESRGGVFSSPVFWVVTGVLVVGAGVAATALLVQDEDQPSSVISVRSPFGVP